MGKFNKITFGKLKARKSLAGNLQLLTSTVFIILISILVTGYSYFSSKLLHEERVDAARALGTTLSKLLTRPVSLGDYLSVEQALSGATLQDFICGIKITTQNNLSIASVRNPSSPVCKNEAQAIDMIFPVTLAGTLDSTGEREIGRVTIGVGFSDLRSLALKTVLFSFLLGSLVLFVLLILNRIAIDWALLPLARAVSAASDPTPNDQEMNRAGKAIHVAPREIQPLLMKLFTLSAKYAKVEGDLRVAKVARQVAHDIRSPLAALEMSCRSKNIPENERVLFRHATTRIRDIANDLSGRFKESSNPDESASLKEPVGQIPKLIPILIDEMVSEIRLRLGPGERPEISSNLDHTNYGLFVAINAAKFKRALSNLIQNAVEAVDQNGRVSILSKRDSGFVQIEVTDNGAGIAEDLLPKLGMHGETFGKPGGSGLGLSFAKQVIEEASGSMEIDSKLGTGTTIRIRFPVAPTPEWFVQTLYLYSDSPVVILDDDPTVHQVWSERLAPSVEKNEITLLHFFSAEDFGAWFNENETLASRAQFLVDFELIGEKETGLSVVEKFKIQNQSTLITSRYDEYLVRAQATKNRVRLIPKGLAPFVPIEVKHHKVSAVLIDDDPLTHQAWQHVAKATKRLALTYFHDREMKSRSIPLDVPIFVDWNLANGEKGADVLRRLKAKGFTELFIYSSEQLESGEIQGLGFIKGIVGKEVPAAISGS